MKAFTLSVGDADADRGADLAQARSFLETVNLDVFLEPLEITRDDLSVDDAIDMLEDYKPLDVQAGAALLALCRAVRTRYPDWKYLLDGDGGDENLKDYSIEDHRTQRATWSVVAAWRKDRLKTRHGEAGA